MTVMLLIGDCRNTLKTMRDKSVNCCVTSPPYFGLRDYQVKEQIGLEPTPDEFVAAMVEVFREVKRVLRDDGTLWLNLGDSYARTGGTDKQQSSSATVGSTRNTLKQMSDRNQSVPDVANLLTRDLESGVIIFGRAHARCTASESIHVLIDDQTAPDGVFQPLFRTQRVLIKQGQNDLCEIGNTFDTPVTCWFRSTLDVSVPDNTAQGLMNLGQNCRVVVATGDLNTDTAFRSVFASTVKNCKAAFPVEIPCKPITESIGNIAPIWDTFTLDTGPICGFQINPINQSVPLFDGSKRDAGCCVNFRVRKATSEHVTFLDHIGREFRFLAVRHLSLLKNDSLTPYSLLLDKAIKKANTLVPKQLLGIPDMVKRALMEDGWICRQTIIWHKPNPMPESVTDRCTGAHEYIFLLSKSPRYYFDSEAIKEPAVSDHKSGNGFKRDARMSYQNADGTPRGNDEQWTDVGGKRNRRSVWNVSTKPFKGAHFATFPPDLIEPCVLAGAPVGGVVLDPFGGAGTTGLVAQRNGRNSVLCELNYEYVGIACERLGDVFGWLPECME